MHRQNLSASIHKIKNIFQFLSNQYIHHPYFHRRWKRFFEAKNAQRIEEEAEIGGIGPTLFHNAYKSEDNH